jgi:nickel transport protein
MPCARSLGPAAALAAGLLFLASATAQAHGVRHKLLNFPGIVAFAVEYSSGEPVAYGAVTIFAPHMEDMEYQNGRTDHAGYFAFIPDRDGEWRVVVDAGMGHRHEFTVQVSPGDTPEPQPESPPGSPLSMPIKIALGISLFLNIFLAGAWYNAKKS